MFGTKERDSATKRSIATKLYDCANKYTGDRRTGMQVEAIQQLETCASMEKDALRRGTTYIILAKLHLREKAHQKAIEAVDVAQDALSGLDLSVAFQTKLSPMLEPALLEIFKGVSLNGLGKKDEAFEMYKQAREIRLNGKMEPVGGIWLNQITLLLDEKMDPDGHRLLDAFKSWTNKERNKFFSYCMLNWKTAFSSILRLFRATLLTNAAAYVLECLNSFGKTLARRSLIFFNLKTSIVRFYKDVCGDLDKAKQTLLDALDLKTTGEGSEEDVIGERVASARIDLAEVIFAQFRVSTDPERKEALVKEMMAIPGMTTENIMRSSVISLFLANMLRIMGPAREYQRTMETLFQLFMDALEDNVAWNDSTSLRLLARVLTAVPGLERDARIAISAQWSVLDRALYERSDGPQKWPKTGAEEDATDEERKGEGTTSANEPEEEDSGGQQEDGEAKGEDSASGVVDNSASPDLETETSSGSDRAQSDGTQGKI